MTAHLEVMFSNSALGDQTDKAGQASHKVTWGRKFLGALKRDAGSADLHSMKLQTILATCVTLFVTLCLVACASGPQSLILGKWEVDGAPVKMTAEFNSDGTGAVTMFGQTLRGKYKLAGDDLEWDLNGRSSKAKVKVTADLLELTDEENRTIRYKRQ